MDREERDGTGFERCVAPDGRVGYRARVLRELGVPHGFTTRIGARGADWDTGRPAGAELEALRRLAGCDPLAEPGTRVVPALARQVHGADCLEVEATTDVSALPADALTTTSIERFVGVVTADCVPVLVAAVDGSRVAAIHAGWRGLVAGVIPNALARFGRVELAAAIGPCLSVQRFEVGPEVAEAFEARGLGAAVQRGWGERPHVDLRAAASQELERAGVRRLDVSTRCTWDDPELWSYRRDVTHGGAARTGRLGAWIAPTAAAR